MITDIILIIGIETKCGMIGLGVIQAGILGVLLIDGHHLDMIDGVMGSTMVGITTDGDIMGTMVMDGIIITGGTITVKMVGTEDEVEIMCRISTVEEVVL